jgi:hypothetical protein
MYYGRFLLHAMAPGRRHAVLAQLAHAMQPPDLALFEFRTPLDAALPKRRVHRRWYVDQGELSRGVAGLGLNLDVDETGTGLAVFGDEDPHVARVTVTVAR